MKALKKVCSFAIALGIVLTPVASVEAADTNSSGADVAKQGVVQVNTVIVDDNSEKSVVIGGTGFLIGDPEGTEYVITSKHIVEPSKETLSDACEYYGVTADGEDSTINLTIATEVVIESDVVLNASVLTSSSELDMVVLQLPQPIYTRTPLKLLTNKQYDVNNLPYAAGDSVYALGYPELVYYNSDTKYYSDQQIQSAAGQIKSLTTVDGVQVVESDAATDYNNYGGPLVDENGYVIGMNLPKQDGENSLALDSTKIAKILDGLGVSYSQANSSPKAQETAEEETTEETEAEPTVPEPVAKPKKGISETMIIVLSLVAVFVVVCSVAGLILYFVNKDRSDAPKADKPKAVKQEKKIKQSKTYNGPVFDFDDIPNNPVQVTRSATPQRSNVMQMAQPQRVQPMQQTSFSDETTILSAAPASEDGETTLLSGELNAPQNLGTLVRKRTSERISLNKSDFIIGKDALHSDYCIEKNSSISRKHAKITSGRNGTYIQDCNSTNGTFINGTKIESERSVLLNDGDCIKFSNEEFEFQA